ncbi:MAG: fibronectin type III domain-containing protein [Halieaceae bacterium]|jgi:hypothetical protein|nr:fibronectin type III domain-containing protein [Halieaceae bacterium]
MKAITAFYLALLVLFHAPTLHAQLTNSGFETGDLTGWSALVEGAANPVTVASGTSNTGFGTITIAPSLSDNFYAYTSQTSPGRTIISQAFTVQEGANRIFFDVAIENGAPSFATPDPYSIDFVGAPNQQARFDIIRPGAAITTVDPADIIIVGFQTQSGDAASQDWRRYEVDVTAELAPFLGQSVTLRFIQVDNQALMTLALDNVSVGTTPPTATIPDAPTIGTATGGDAEATVTFTAPGEDGGSAITGYTATSSPGGITGTCASSPCTVSGLTNGTTYTFTVVATNAVGNSPASAASNSVTPALQPPQLCVVRDDSAAAGNGYQACNSGQSEVRLLGSPLSYNFVTNNDETSCYPNQIFNGNVSGDFD